MRTPAVAGRGGQKSLRWMSAADLELMVEEDDGRRLAADGDFAVLREVGMLLQVVADHVVR